MYTHGIQTYEFVKLSGAPVEIEDTADILALKGRVADVGTGTDSSHDAVFFPYGGQIENFGFLVTEALTGAHATNCVLALKVIDADGSTSATVATMEVPAVASEITVANVFASDTAAGGVTQAQAVAVGARFVSSDADIPFAVPPGGRFFVEVTQAAGSAGGAFRAFVQARHNGSPSPAAAADSPITKIAA